MYVVFAILSNFCYFVFVSIEGWKNHTCEEGGAHLRISFWHLLMNFEKPEKSEFWKNEKKKNCWRYHHFTQCTKPQSYEVQFLRYRAKQKFFVILGNFLLFYRLPNPLTIQKTKIWKKWKKHLEMPSF